MSVLHTLAPVFILVALGRLLCSSGFHDQGFARGLNRLTYWFALPALLTHSIAKADLGGSSALYISLVIFIAGLLTLLAGYIVGALVFRMRGIQLGSYVPAVFRSNVAYVGLAVVDYSLTDRYPDAVSIAVVAVAPLVILYNIMAVVILLAHSENRDSSGGHMKTVLIQVVRNPFVLSCGAGLAINLLQIPLPAFLYRTLLALGGAALPLALLSIGASLTLDVLKGAAATSLVGALIKVALSPLLGLMVCKAIGLPALETQITLIMLACPTAIATYVMTEVLHGDSLMVGRIIVISTLLSALSLSVVLAFGL